MKLMYKLAIALCFLPMFTFSQNYSIANIPKELLINANAVVRLSKQDILVKNEKSMDITFHYVVTVLNSDGNKFLELAKDYDDNSKIKSISAIEYNAFGQEVRTYSKKSFKDHSAFSGSTFYSDDRIKYLDFTPKRYPYTIEFEYEFKNKTTAFLPMWTPIKGYGVSVQKSEFFFRNPKNIPLLKREKNIEYNNVQNKSLDNVIHYVLENSKALSNESFAVSISNVVPSVKLFLTHFVLNGFEGSNITTWEKFGKWLRENLYDSRLELSQTTKNEVKNLVANETDTLKKAQLVYEFMQNKTRYVNVAIGVGGWRPSLADDVDRLGYGDCKGLTNYTKALLDVAGIQSYWTLVFADDKINFDSEFHGFQGNHMILNVPKINKGKDVWLECTNQQMPFNFLGDFTDDRDVLVLEENGGIIKHTPKYKKEQNTQYSKVYMNIDTLGNITANLNIESKGIQYDRRFWIDQLTNDDINKYYTHKRWDDINNLTVEKHEFTNNKNTVSFTENLKVNIQKYAPFVGENMVLKLNVFNTISNAPENYKNRKYDFEISRGFTDVDEVEIVLPKQYNVNNLVENVSIENMFGTYKIGLERKDERTLKYTRYLSLNANLYAKEHFNSFSNFLAEIKKRDNLKILLKRKDEKTIIVNNHHL